MYISLNDVPEPKTIFDQVFEKDGYYPVRIDINCIEMRIEIGVTWYENIPIERYIHVLNVRHPIMTLKALSRMWSRSVDHAIRSYKWNPPSFLTRVEILELLESDYVSDSEIVLTDQL